MSEADGVKEDVLVVPPYELYCSILGVDKKKGIPILNELPAELFFPY